MAAAAIAAGMPERCVWHTATNDRGGRRRPASGARRRPGARQRLTRDRHRPGGGTAEGGVRLMLYYLHHLSDYAQVMNVTRYITFRTAAASLTALAIGLFLGPFFIRKLREFQIGQVIRQEGPATHRKKAGTPTMGGLLIMASALIPTLLWADLTNPFVWSAVLTTTAFGAHRIRRRLSEDRPPVPSRPAAPLQDGLDDRRRPGLRRRADRAELERAVQHAADLSVLQALHSRHRSGCTCRLPRWSWSARRMR